MLECFYKKYEVQKVTPSSWSNKLHNLQIGPIPEGKISMLNIMISEYFRKERASACRDSTNINSTLSVRFVIITQIKKKGPQNLNFLQKESKLQMGTQAAN